MNNNLRTNNKEFEVALKQALEEQLFINSTEATQQCVNVKGYTWTEATQSNAWENYEIDCFYGSNSYTAGNGHHTGGGHWVQYLEGSYDCLGKGSGPEVCEWTPL